MVIMSGFVGGAFAEDVCGEYDDQGVCTYVIPEIFLPPKNPLPSFQTERMCA